MAGVLQLSAVSIVAKHREWRRNEECGRKGIFRAALKGNYGRKRRQKSARHRRIFRNRQRNSLESGRTRLEGRHNRTPRRFVGADSGSRSRASYFSRFRCRYSGPTGKNIAQLAERLGGIDLLVVSAGTGFINPDLKTSLETQTITTNVAAFTVAVDWGYRYFKSRGSGHIAAITSVGGLLAESGAPAYPASKAYQILYLQSLAKRAKKDNPGCAFTELRPGSVNTDMMKGEGHFWISSPQQAAALACQAILYKKRLQYISRHWSLLGFLLRLSSLFS